MALLPKRMLFLGKSTQSSHVSEMSHRNAAMLPSGGVKPWLSLSPVANRPQLHPSLLKVSRWVLLSCPSDQSNCTAFISLTFYLPVSGVQASKRSGGSIVGELLPLVQRRCVRKSRESLWDDGKPGRLSCATTGSKPGNYPTPSGSDRDSWAKQQLTEGRESEEKNFFSWNSDLRCFVPYVLLFICVSRNNTEGACLKSI